MNTGFAIAACPVELPDHELWAVIAQNWQAYGASLGVPPPNTGWPANACLIELDDHTLRAIVAYYVNAIAAL
jgi:hypothetical protein